jgi:hypothetical protein
MFQKISNSWALVKASAGVLKADKELLIFPILSAIGTLIVTLTFFVPTILAGLFDNLFTQDSQVLGYIVLFFFYLAQYFVVFFANTALVGAALIRLRGGNPTVGDGFRIAFSHFGVILGYALIAATVGVILKVVSEKSKGLGRAMISLIGFAWNIATFLVVPILAVEDVGPFEAIKRSVQLLKKTWGEQIAGNLGMGAFFGLLTFVILLVGIPLSVFTAITTESIWLTAAVAILFIFILIITGLISSTLSGVYTAAVYQYAVDGRSDGFFEPEMVKNAFKATR